MTGRTMVSPLPEQEPLWAAPMAWSFENGAESVTARLTGPDWQVSLARSVPPGLTGHAAWWKAFMTDSRRPVDDASRPEIRMLDLFSSVGGLSLGVTEAARLMERRVVHELAVDVDGSALEVYRSNFPEARIHNGSVTSLVEARVRGAGQSARFVFPPEVAHESLARLSGKLDLVVAGPPCQGHSTLNNHSRGADPRNALYLMVPAIAIAVGTPNIIIENVPNVVRDKLGVVSTTRHLLRSAGYEISDGVLAASDLGWAQTRKRFFMVASRTSTPVDLKQVLAVMGHSAMPISWAIGDLIDELDQDDLFRSVPRLSPENEGRIRHLFSQDLYDLPLDVRPDCHKDGTTYKAVYGRMRWDEPAPTLTTGFMTPGRGRFVHPKRPRVLTPHEAARIQGFPDWFNFAPDGLPLTRRLLAKWIGDAVPSIMGSAAALSLLAGAR